MNARRILLTLSYDGTEYAGWQYQENALSVQEKVEEILSAIEKTPMRIVGASRTDAGVHAQGQRAHFDTFSRIPTDKYPFALNALLPSDIRVNKAAQVADTLHARFSARRKEYRYLIDNRRHANALTQRFAAHVPLHLDAEKMHQSAQTLVGVHDFAAFEASGGTAKTTVRTIESVSVKRENNLVELRITGNAFLYNMVRIIAGTLIQIGQEKLPPDAFSQAIAHKDRLLLGPTAPAKGLTLYSIDYEEGDNAYPTHSKRP